MSQDIPTGKRLTGAALAALVLAAGLGAALAVLVGLPSAAGGRWQGHITHVQSGRAAYFRDMEEMLGFIGDRLEGGRLEEGGAPDG